MNKRKLLFLCGTFLCCTTVPLHSAPDSSLLPSYNASHIHYSNCVLAKVNGKAITLYDIVKKMDMIFYKQFPQYRDVVEAKYQFYQVNWKHFLQEQIDKELVIADAEENKMNVSAGDIRQEMETLFGPNIIASLDQIGLSYDDAWNMLKGDITIRRMIFARVNVKTQRAITPSAVRTAYVKYAAENINPERWKYQVVSFRDSDTTRGAEAANLAYQLLTVDNKPIESLMAELEKNGIKKETSVNISEEFFHNPKEVSAAYRDILANLDSKTYSHPVAQKSKAAKSTVFRIFYLKERVPAGADPLPKVENQLKEKLFSEVSEAETLAYFNKLNKQFPVQKFITDDNYQPFTLR